jgi:hypothetical protein
MSRVLIVLIVMIGLLVEMTLRFALLIVITCTLIGLMVLADDDLVGTLVKPSLYPLVNKALEG